MFLPSFSISLTTRPLERKAEIRKLSRLLMKRRREHGECERREGGRGCLVFQTPVCSPRKKRSKQLLAIMRIWMGKLIALDAYYCWILIVVWAVCIKVCAGLTLGLE